MALTVNDFFGFETGGAEEAQSVSGTPVFNTTIPRSGTTCLELTGTENYVVTWNGAKDAGGSYIIGLAYRKSANPSTRDEIMFVVDDGNGTILQLYINADGTIDFVDAQSNIIDTSFALDSDRWYYIEIFADLNNASGNWEWFFDGISEGSDTGADLTDGNAFGGIDSEVRFFGAGSANAFFDDIYILSGATASSDRLGSSTLASMPEVFGYQHSVTGATADAGLNATEQTDLSNSTVWETTADGGVSTQADMDSSPHYGTVDMDGPSLRTDGDLVDNSPLTSTGGVAFGNTASTVKMASSFIPTRWAEPTSIQVRTFKSGSPTDNFIVSIQGDSGGEPDGSDIVTFDETAGADITGFENLTLNAITSAPLLAGTLYWLVYRRSGSVDASNWFAYVESSDGDASTGRKTFNGSVWGSLLAAADGEYIIAGTGTIDGDPNIKATKLLIHLDRDGGGGTLHYIGLGDSADGDNAGLFNDNDDWGPVTQTPTWYGVVTEDVPTAVQDIRAGAGTGGAQNLNIFEIWTFLLHVPSAAPAPSGPPIGTLALMGVGI